MENSPKSKSGQAPKEMIERQNWIQDKFLGLSKSSGFKSLQIGASASAASAHDISQG